MEVRLDGVDVKKRMRDARVNRKPHRKRENKEKQKGDGTAIIEGEEFERRKKWTRIQDGVLIGQVHKFIRKRKELMHMGE